MKVSTDVTSIFDVLHKHDNGDVVSVKAHVDSKSCPETVHSASLKKDLIKSTLTVADSTAAIIMGRQNGSGRRKRVLKHT